MAGREENFPRGGIKFTKEMRYSGATESALPFSSRNGRQQASKSRKRKRSLSPLLVTTVPSKELLLTTADTLTYKALQENMLVLGCIRNITSLSLEVELPGKIFGQVGINLISNRCNQLLVAEVSRNKEVYEDVLETMFYKGQFVPTKVLQKLETSNGTKVKLSIEPEDINRDLHSAVFQQGLLVWASVDNKEDHGYSLSAGVKFIKMFLPFENVPEGRQLVVGQPLWCTIRNKVPIGTAVITVSILEEDLAGAQLGGKSLLLHHLIPGMQVDFTVSKSVKYGIQGEFMKGCTGYINQAYLVKPMDNISKYQPGQNFRAWLLYIQPITKFAYFTLRGMHSLPDQVFQIGNKLQSTVLGKAAGGLTIKLPNQQRGFVSYNRLVQLVPNNTNPATVIHRNFPQGSSHQCQVLNYSDMEQLYICTFEKSKEAIYTIEDVNLGQLVQVKVLKIEREGLVVRLGKINAFIQNIHLSNVAYTQNIKKKFSVGQVLQARVLSNDGKGVLLTHKQDLIHADLCLCRYGDAEVGKQYLAVVVNIGRSGILVVYFGNVRGMLPWKYLYKKFPDYTEDKFYEGQVIKTTVWKVSPDKLYISLDVPTSSKMQRIYVGQFVDAVVWHTVPKGLVVAVGPNHVQGFVPVLHLSSTLHLTPLLLNVYKPGDIIKDLLCIENRQQPILSRREALAYKRQNLKVLKWSDLEVGTIIRASYESIDKSGITVSAVFKSKSWELKIFNQELDENPLKLEPQQAVVARVIKLSDNTPKLTARLSKVFNCDYEYSLDLLEQCLQDTETIRDHLLKENLLLTKVRLGQRVHGVVVEVEKSGCLIVVEKGVKAYATTEHCFKNIQLGQKVTGVVLQVNYPKEFLEVSLLRRVDAKINEVQDGVINKSFGSTVYADLLLVVDNYVVAVLRGQDTNRQLIFLPTIYHENSFKAFLSYGGILNKIKVLVCRKVGNMLIGIKKSHLRELRSMKKRGSLRQRVVGNRSRVVAAEDPIDDTPETDSENEYEPPVPDSDESDIEESDEENMSEDQEMLSQDDSYEEPEDEAEDLDLDDEDEAELNQKLNNSEIKEDCVVVDDVLMVKKDDEAFNDMDSEDDFSESIDETGTGREADDSNTAPVKPKGTKLLPLVEGVKHFFSNGSTKTVSFKEASSEEDTDEEPMKAIKKKVTPAERKEIERLKEEELQRIEQENADLTVEPQTVEQFQKLIKGKPNCSKSWAKYIAHLVNNAELEKAKEVAREALKTIDVEKVQERYNIWIVYLNLENSYGDKSTLNEVFEEAVKCNDDLSIYLDVIKMLGNSQKLVEMQEKVQKAKRKFKQLPKMWTEIGRVYYQHNLLKEARNLKEEALRTIHAKNKHVGLIVQFALMEFQFGEKSYGEALFETVLQHNPKRVDIWSTYIDQVVKKGDFDVARRIFERGVSQDFSARKSASLFKKFKEFEKKNGDLESIEHVVLLARQYAARK